MNLLETTGTRKLCVTAVLTAVALGVHYSGIPHDYMSMAVALNIVPVSYAAFAFGVRGVIVVGLVVALAALPHSFLFHPAVETAAEVGEVMILVAAGLLVGRLASREKQHKERLQSAASQIRVSEKKYRQLFENASDAILVCSSNGTVLASNNAGAELLGRSRGQMEGMKLERLVRRGPWDEARRHLLENGDSPGRTYLHTNVDGKPGKLVEATFAPVEAADSGIADGWMIILREANESQDARYVMQHYIRGITRAQEEERKRIARELHDETIQNLIAVSRRLDTLESGMQRREDVAEQLSDAGDVVASTIKSLRRFTSDLRPSVLDDLGLVPAVEWLTQRLSSLEQMDVSLDICGEPRRLLPDKELTLFRIVQEALTNVEKHSQATRVNVKMVFQPRKVEITVSDNGNGFEPSQSSRNHIDQEKLGLLGMQERVALLGGALKIDSRPGGGTEVHLSVDI